MKTLKFALLTAVALVAAFSLNARSADWEFRPVGGHFGLFIGIPLFPWYYPPPPVYYPPPIAYYPPPPAYYSAPPAPPPPRQELRYYCPDSKRYYPDVRKCPSGWLRVIPGSGSPL
jgi:hypothetical protein